MNDTPAVLAAGCYLPRFGLPGARGALRVCNGDEDSTTLAVEAAQDCLSRHCTDAIDEVHLATAGADCLDGSQAQVVREALGLDATTSIALSAGDALGGLTALFAAIDAVAAGRVGSALVVAVEPGDGARISAGAVALLIGRTADPALRLSSSRSRGEVSRANGDRRYLDHRRDELVAACGAGPNAIPPDRGVAGPLLALLTTAGPLIATTESRVIIVEVTRDPGSTPLLAPAASDGPAEEPTEVRSSPPLSLPGGSPFFQRSARELLRLEGGRCRRCGHVVFPPSQRPICSVCHGTDFDPAPISRTGVVHTYVVNRFLPTGFGAEMALVLADLEDGNRYWAPTSGIPSTDLTIGMEVELRLRRFTDAGGAPTYAMKFVPRRTSTARTAAA